MIFMHKNKYLLVSFLMIFLLSVFYIPVYANSDTDTNTNTSKEKNIEEKVENENVNNKEEVENYENELYVFFKNLNDSRNRVEKLDSYEYLFKYRIPKNESIYFFKNAYEVLDVQGFKTEEGIYKALVTLEFSSDSTIYQWVTMEKQEDGYYLISIEKDFEDFYLNKDSFDGEAVEYLITVSYDFNHLNKDDFINKYFPEQKDSEYERNKEEINKKYDELKKIEFFSIYIDEDTKFLKDNYSGKEFYVYDKNEDSLTSTPYFYMVKNLETNQYNISFEEASKEYFDSGISDVYLVVIGLALAIPVIFVLALMTNNSSSNYTPSYSSSDSETHRSIHDTINAYETNNAFDDIKKESMPSTTNTVENILSQTNTNNQSNNNTRTTNNNKTTSKEEPKVNKIKENQNRSIVFDENENKEDNKLTNLTKTKRSIHFDDE